MRPAPPHLPKPQDECAYHVVGPVSGGRGRRTRAFSKLCVTQRFGYLAFDKYDNDD